MTEPWMTIWALTYLGLLVAAGAVLLYWAIRLRCLPLVVLCTALVLWPIVGEVVNALARHLAREALRAGDTSFLGIWEDSAGGFITKVAMLVNIVQAGLVLVASLLVARLLRRKGAHANGHDHLAGD